MPKVLWIVDGVGWGYDNLANAIKNQLPGYEHIMISKKRDRVVYGDGRSGFICECDESFMEKINNVNADVIVSMNPMNKRFITDKTKGIVRISGQRALDGWHR